MEFVDVAGRPIAVLRRPGKAPGLFWMSGFRSDMTGAKASALDAFGERHGLSVTRFDYSGHGQSGGDFNEGTISRWLEEALAVLATTTGPQIVVGSSMGGWLALLLAKALRLGGSDRLQGLVLIAPATDMTDLMQVHMTPAQRATLAAGGHVDTPSDYSADPYRINGALIADGTQHRLFGRAIETGCPVVILQGALDEAVPREHALKLVQHLVNDPVTLTLVPDGDHRLSRPEDLALLDAALARLVAGD